MADAGHDSCRRILWFGIIFDLSADAGTIVLTCDGTNGLAESGGRDVAASAPSSFDDR